jgi:hypothetical protein
MSAEYIETVARAIARRERRAIPIRDTSGLAWDPEPAFGIAPIRVVSEQRVQSIAFGFLNAEPQVVVDWNPLSRESSVLEPFAAALDEYLTSAIAHGRTPRVWLPHPAALEVVDLLGHRYRSNKDANPVVRTMGAHCRALAEEARFPGQQIVSVASNLLTAHVVTGQSPIEDRHLGALLAWIRPVPGVDPLIAARESALIPVAAMLERDVDDEVEALRKAAKGATAAAESARRRIEERLGQAALREWQLLLEARRAFWSLGLLPAPGNDKLVTRSVHRFAYALRKDQELRAKGAVRRSPSRPDTLTQLLDQHEHATELLEDIDVRSDVRLREHARREGRAMVAQVVKITQPIPNRHPCTLTLQTTQEVRRVRRGTILSKVDGRVRGRVDAEREEPATGATLYELTLVKGGGVQSSRLPRLGDVLDWVDSAPFDAPLMKQKLGIYQAQRTAQHPLVYRNTLPAAVPRQLPQGDLASLADSLRTA